MLAYLLYVSLYKEEVVLTHGPEHQLTTRHAMFSAGVKTKLLHATTLHIVSFDHTVLASSRVWHGAAASGWLVLGWCSSHPLDSIFSTASYSSRAAPAQSSTTARHGKYKSMLV